MINQSTYVIGVDYGTDSCRVLVVDTATGTTIASSVVYYPRWKQGLYCKPAENQYRQHPLDYLESLEEAVAEALRLCPSGTASRVVGISCDTTASTPVLLDRQGTPLALLPEFSEDPDAMFILWKDHTAIREAGEINTCASSWHTDYTRYSGGTYSSEWVWAKVLHVLRRNPALRKKVWSWCEHCDWIPAVLTGKTKPEEMVRNRCTAGHKAMWNAEWGGLPPQEFFRKVDPLYDLFEDHLYTHTCTSDQPIGTLNTEWTRRLGLPGHVVVGVGEIDCHMGAIGAGIREGDFVRVMGTSTCDILVVSPGTLVDRAVTGICGQVDGSVLPGMTGLEAGQSAFGDLYAWFRDLLAWPLYELLPENEAREEWTGKILPVLTREAEKLPVSESAPVALDWHNGRRTPHANPWLTGAVAGLTLATSAPMLYRALVEATAFGSKAIMENLLSYDIPVGRVVALGGIAYKSPFVMQVLADVLGRPIQVSAAEQSCALGAAMCAAVAAGIYPTIQEAQQKMGQGFGAEYYPDTERQAIYERIYKKYLSFGNYIEEQAGMEKRERLGTE